MNEPLEATPAEAKLGSMHEPTAPAPVHVLTPAQRLEASRMRMRKSWLREPSKDAAAAPRNDEGSTGGSTLRRMRRLAAAGWARHPLKGGLDTVSNLAGPMVQSALAPIPQAHPLRLLASAAAAAKAWGPPSFACDAIPLPA